MNKVIVHAPPAFEANSRESNEKEKMLISLLHKTGRCTNDSNLYCDKINGEGVTYYLSNGAQSDILGSGDTEEDALNASFKNLDKYIEDLRAKVQNYDNCRRQIM